MYSRRLTLLVHTNTPTCIRDSLCNICVRFSIYVFGVLPPSTWLSDWPDLVSLLWERSTGVMAKVVPVQPGPESHKVSVVLLKCCSILFICKCCNLSMNVVNTNEQRRGGKPPTFYRGQKRAPEPLHGPRKLRTLPAVARLCVLYRGTVGVLLTALQLPHRCQFVCTASKPRWWLVIYNRAVM